MNVLDIGMVLKICRKPKNKNKKEGGRGNNLIAGLFHDWETRKAVRVWDYDKQTYGHMHLKSYGHTRIRSWPTLGFYRVQNPEKY